MRKLRIRQVLVVEGKYDAISLESIVDGLIITTDGFTVFTDSEKKDLIKNLGKKRGLIVLTDSDAAGFKIRNLVEKIAGECEIHHVYIPEIEGKESRKSLPSKEGTLGVEGVPQDILRSALAKFAEENNGHIAPERGRQITHTDLYLWGISGTEGSAEKRRQLLRQIGLPARLSKKALCAVLNSLYSYDEFEQIAATI